ncbi:polymerase [Curionopolis virus]|uniref:Replicase n=1 Tax=Curionopolis virus TaxID=490110 RepID=A0A0D3R139_9RHAB|nr:polymerase [Curionopolis virus]AJR28363.1 polymerase [Curionopolis virus]
MELGECLEFPEHLDLEDSDFFQDQAYSKDQKEDNSKLLFNQDYNLNSPVLNDSREDFLNVFEDPSSQKLPIISLNRREETFLRTSLNSLKNAKIFGMDEEKKFLSTNRSVNLTVGHCHELFFKDRSILSSVVTNLYPDLLKSSLEYCLKTKAVGEAYFGQSLEFPSLESFLEKENLIKWGEWFLFLHSLVLGMNCRSEEELSHAFSWTKKITSYKVIPSKKGEEGSEGNFLEKGVIINTPFLDGIVLWREFLLIPCKKLLLNKNQVMMYKDTLLARTQSMISILIDGGEMMLDRMNNLEKLYQIGDEIIIKMGSDGYDLIKLLEPMSISRIQELSDSIKPLFPKFEEFKTHVEIKAVGFDQSSGGLSSTLYKFICKQDQFSTLLDTFSSFRHWGHPFINYKEGLKKLKHQVRLEKDIDEDYAESLASDLAFKILKNKFLEDKRWYVDLSKMDSKNIMYQFVEENTWPSQNIIEKFGDNWHRLPLTQCFEVPELLDPAQIYSDKSHSGTREEVLDFLANNRRGPVKTKKVLQTMLETPERDWRAFFTSIDENGFEPNSLIIGLKGKERELKIIGRYFALLSWDLRDYFVATEYLIKKYIVPYFGGLTMADDLLGVIKKMLSNAQGQGRDDYEMITIADHIDYEKWNNHQREESNRSIFQVMDKFLGYNNLISRTHQVFQQSWIYYAGRSDMLESRGKRIVDISKEGCYFWNGQDGGLEGLRQKGWTVVSFLVVERESRKRNTLVKVLAQGDNQIVTTHYKTRKTRTEGELLESLMEIRRNNDILMRSIIEGTNKLGLIINDDETVKSTDFLIYGKVPIIRSQMKGLPIKRWSRVNCVTNDQLPSMGSVLSSSTTNALTTCHFSSSPIESVKNHLFFCNIGIELIRRFNPALGKGFDTDSEVYKKAIEDPLGRIILIYLDPSLGGRCGTNLCRFSIRMFPDPVSEGLSFWKYIGKRCTELRSLAAEIGNPELKRREMKDLEKLLEDPTSLNFKKIPSIQGVLKNEVKRSLTKQSYKIKNNIMRLSLRFHEEEEERYIKWLLSIKPLFPKFVSECYGASFHGLVKSLIGLFSNSKSIRNICKCDYKGDLSRIVRNFEIDILRSTSDLVTKARRSSRSIWACSASLADVLRKRSWGDDIVGMTIPHPLELLGRPERSESCSGCKNSDGTVYVTALCPQGIPKKSESRGPFEPYLGSNTSEGTSILTPWEKETSIPLVRKAMRLRNSISWFIEPGSHVGKAILNNLEALTGEKWDQDLGGYQRTGSALHRFGCSRVSSGGFCANSPEGPSWIVMTSDTLGTLNEKNHDFMYQSLFIHLQGRLLVEPTKQVPGIWHSHIECKECIREIQELKLESDFEFEFKPVHHFLEKWIPNMKTAFSEKNRSISIEIKEWDIVNGGSKSYQVGKVMGYLYGDKILNRTASAEESSLYPLSIRNKLNPGEFTKGVCHGIMIAGSLSILLRRNVIKGKRIDQALMGSASWIVNELVRQEKFLHFLSGSSVLDYLLRLPHKPIASYPPNGVELGYMFRTRCLKLIERSINSPKDTVCFSRLLSTIWIFSDIRDNRIVGSLIIGSLVVMKIIKASKKTDTNWMKQMQQAYITLLGSKGEDQNPIVGEMTNCLSVLGTDSEIRHSMKSEPDWEAMTSEYDFGQEEEYGYVVSRDLDEVLLQKLDAEEESEKAPKIQNPLISSLRLAQLATGAHYKIRSLIRDQKLKYSDFMCLGDGSGGMTSCLLRENRLSRGIFNSLLDLTSTPLRGMKPGPPSAVLELGSESCRCVNLLTCWENPSNLCFSSTWRYFDKLIARERLDIDLIVIDAEFRDRKMAESIEENLLMFLFRHSKRTKVIYKSYYDRMSVEGCLILKRSQIFKKITFNVTEFTSSGSSEIYLVLEFDPNLTKTARDLDQMKISSALRKICFCFKSQREEHTRALKIAREKNLLKGIPQRVLPNGLEELISIMIYFGVESGHAMKIAGKMREEKGNPSNWLSVIFSLASNKHLDWSHYPNKPRWCSDGEVQKILCLYVSTLFIRSIWEEDLVLYKAGERFLRTGGGIVFSAKKVQIKSGKTRHDVKGLYLDDKMALLGGTIRSFFLLFGTDQKRPQRKEHDKIVREFNEGCRSKIMIEKLELEVPFWT